MVERFDDNVFENDKQFLKSLGHPFYKESDFSNIDIDETPNQKYSTKQIN